MSTDFRSELLAKGLLVETGVDGLYGRSGTFENVVRGIDDLVTAAGADQGASVLHFPAVIPRTVLERSGYPKSFPDLLGSVSVFEGGEEVHAELLERLARGQDWGELLTPSDVASLLCRMPPALSLLFGTPSCRWAPLRGLRALLPPRTEPRSCQNADVPPARVRLSG